MKERCNFIALLATVIFFLFHAATGFNMIDPSTMKAKSTFSRGMKSNSLIMFLSSTEQEQAAAMSEYLVRSHVAKLKAVQELEESKKNEIDALSQEIIELKEKLQQQPPPPPTAATTAASTATTPHTTKSSPPAAGKDLSSLSKEELIAQVLSYQKFMGDYVIDAHVQKVMFVKAAEESVAKKYEELLASSSASSIAATTTAAPPKTEKIPESSNEKKMYLERNAEVAKASDAGKSRWGDKEVQRVKDEKAPVVVEKKPVVNKSAEKVNGVKDEKAPVVVEKKPVVNKSAEKVNGKKTPPEMKMPPKVNGTKKPTATKEEVPPEVTVAESVVVNIGASIMNGAANGATIPVPPEVEAADHGLRADGGVGGLSLAERVSQGANAPAHDPVHENNGSDASEMELIFRQRNKLIADAGKAGKSRWGNLEIGKAKECVTKHDTKLSSETKETKSSQQGDVNTLTTSERVNLGAQILGKK